MNTDSVVHAVTLDRMITIKVGKTKDQATFMLQEALLRKTSSVFAAAIDHEHLGGGKRGVLEFPEDNVEAWKLLVYCTFERTLPPTTSAWQNKCLMQATLVECWILGDKYNIKPFQDLVMRELICGLNIGGFTKTAVEKIVLGTRAGSKLRVLAAREVASSVLEKPNAVSAFEDLMGEDGFGRELIIATRRDNELAPYGAPSKRYNRELLGLKRDREDYMFGKDPAVVVRM